jgi:hypothetical protein
MAIEKELLDQVPRSVEWLSDNGSPFTAKRRINAVFEESRR